MKEKSDPALRILLEMRTRVAPDVDESLVLSLYAIQKRHQYDQDRTRSLNQMERLIDDYVDRLAGSVHGDDRK